MVEKRAKPTGKKVRNFFRYSLAYLLYLPLQAPAYCGSSLARPSKPVFSLLSTVTENVCEPFIAVKNLMKFAIHSSISADQGDWTTYTNKDTCAPITGLHTYITACI